MMKNNNCFMKQTRVKSVGNGFIIDENGRSLQLIGNLPIKENDLVWTDGRVVYGHRPIRPTVKPAINDAEAIPVLTDKLNGYIASRNGQYKGKDWGVGNDKNNFFMNNETDIFENEQLNYVSNTYLLDAEIGEAENIYFYAGRTERITQITYKNMKVDGDEVKNYSNSPYTFNINVVKITKNKQDGFQSQLLERITHKMIRDTFVKEFAKRYIRCNFSRFTTQLLDFRFIDKKGNYEIFACCFAKGTGFVHAVADVAFGRFVWEQTRKDEYLGSEPFINNTTTHRWRVTKYAKSTYEEPTGYIPDDEAGVNINDAFYVVRIFSNGDYEILQKKYIQPERSFQYVSGFHINSWKSEPSELIGLGWAFIPEFPLNGYPTGSFTYIVNVVYPNGSTVDESKAPDYAGTQILESYDVTMQDLVLEYDTYTVPKEEVEQLDNFTIKLNEGYAAETDIFNLYNVSKVANSQNQNQQGQSNLVANKIDSINISYKIEPYDGDTKKRTMYNGVVEYGTTTDDYGFYCVQDADNQDDESANDPPRYHMIPHVCVGELKNGYLISASGDKYHKGNLYKSDAKTHTLTKLDKKSVNIRLNEVRRVRRLKKK